MKIIRKTEATHIINKAAKLYNYKQITEKPSHHHC